MDKIRATIKESLYRKLTLGYSLARTVTFATQGVFLPWVDLIATGRKREVPKNYSEHLKQALPKIQKLLANDAENIHNNFYPVQVLWPENPFTHGLRLPKIVIDSIQASKRREQKNNDYFEAPAQEFLEELPDYYKRNFHFQTSGYLGEQSADLYEHQVEILFSGAADAMRRLIIPQVKLHLRSLGLDDSGAGLQFLELGSGTGRLTRFMALAFPKANITSLDLSSVYLSKAKERLSQFKRINFIQGAAEKIPFQNEKFDVVFSCFLFHELPFEIREQVMLESVRVTKNMGLISAVDSLQKDDDQDFQWALEQFPQDFHEPFYKNYTLHPLSDQWSSVGLKNVQSETGFLAKVISGVKTAN